jgi:hypothetical protein
LTVTVSFDPAAGDIVSNLRHRFTIVEGANVQKKFGGMGAGVGEMGGVVPSWQGKKIGGGFGGVRGWTRMESF